MKMRGIVTLQQPIKIDGRDISELSYDMEEITVEQFTAAEAKKGKAINAKGGMSTSMMEFDSVFHLYLAFMGIIAVNPKYTTEDLGRVKGFDMLELTKIGRNFTNGASGVPSPDGPSESPSEPIAESITLPKENSEADE